MEEGTQQIEQISQAITNPMSDLENLKNYIQNSEKLKIVELICKLTNEETEPIAKKDQEEDKEFLNEKYIIGLTITYKNIYNGEIKVMEHKCSDKITGMKELKIKRNVSFILWNRIRKRIKICFIWRCKRFNFRLNENSYRL